MHGSNQVMHCFLGSKSSVPLVAPSAPPSVVRPPRPGCSFDHFRQRAAEPPVSRGQIAGWRFSTNSGTGAPLRRIQDTSLRS